MSKLLVVVGATGTQGSTVISHFLAHEPTYKIRGLTRNLSTPKAQALTAQGVEMVAADLNEPTSLISAFQGANAIFAYTDFAGCAASEQAEELVKGSEGSLTIPQAGAEVEFQQGKNIADAAAAVAVAVAGSESLGRLVLSLTPDPPTVSGGAFPPVYELAAKARIWTYMNSLAPLQDKLSSVTFAIFTESFEKYPEAYGWHRKTEKEYGFRVPVRPSSPMSFVAMGLDAGSYVSALLRAPAGLSARAVGGKMSFEDVARILERKLGIEVSVEEISVEQFSEGDESGLMKDVALLLKFVEEWGIWDGSEVALTAGQMADRGYRVKQTDPKICMEGADWSMLLK